MMALGKPQLPAKFEASTVAEIIKGYPKFEEHL